MLTTFGIEEEFMFLDPDSLTPVDLGPHAVTHLRVKDAGTVTGEFFCSQIEYATPVCATLTEAREALLEFRSRLGRWAAEAGVISAGTGTPLRARRDAAISPGKRYQRVAGDIGGLSDEHQINGLHVHVGIPDRDAGIRASNALRPWLPTLLALSGNSPFWQAHDTGFDSWRAIHERRWTTHGIPPRFRDARDYDDTVAALTGIGATSDAGTVNWNIRLSGTFPTLEVRVCDAQLDATSSVTLAVIIRALVDATQQEDLCNVRPTDVSVDAALWHAARYGLRGELVHPVTGRPAAVRDVLRALNERIAGHLNDAHERRAVEVFFDRAGNGATLQRSVGSDGLARLYQERLTATC